MLTMSSTALPKVALSSPPKASPTLSEICSVANERTAARGMMAKKLRVKTAVALHPTLGATMPRGMKKSRMLTGPWASHVSLVKQVSCWG